MDLSFHEIVSLELIREVAFPSMWTGFYKAGSFTMYAGGIGDCKAIFESIAIMHGQRLHESNAGNLQSGYGLFIDESTLRMYCNMMGCSEVSMGILWHHRARRPEVLAPQKRHASALA